MLAKGISKLQFAAEDIAQRDLAFAKVRNQYEMERMQINMFLILKEDL